MRGNKIYNRQKVTKEQRRIGLVASKGEKLDQLNFSFYSEMLQQ